MSRLSAFVACASVFALGACAVAPPSGPSVAVMPGPGKSLAQFQQDDYTCRNFATGQTGGMQPAQAANNSAVGSAAVGTLLGAAAGAALGAAAGNPGIGAAAGAGAGLLMGSSVGASNAQASADSVQDRYDMAYEQCMATQGNRIPAPQPAPVAYEAPPPVTYYAAPSYYGPAYYAPGPTVVVGYGHYHRWHRW